jgi:hypothetical protein
MSRNEFKRRVRAQNILVLVAKQRLVVLTPVFHLRDHSFLSTREGLSELGNTALMFLVVLDTSVS